MAAAVVVHYAEIGLKGKNRGFFVNTLVRNIRQSLRGTSYESVEGMFGRIMIRLREDADVEAVRQRLRRVPGIANFSFAAAIPIPAHPLEPLESDPSYQAMQEEAWALVEHSQARTFAVRAQRAHKEYPMRSLDLERELGAYVIERAEQAGRPLRVDLTAPDLVCRVEVVRPTGFVYGLKEGGPGGLPVGSSGRLVALLSAGFDSPVASYMMMKRGAHVTFVHFHAHPLTDRSSMESVRDLVDVLDGYQQDSRLVQVAFGHAQQEIIGVCSRALRMVIYRRMMMRISSQIARREKALGLITGESLGQVASQTLENLAVIDAAAEVPVYRPLIGMNKDEIIALADRIGTKPTSSEPTADCCSLMVAQHPVTRSDLSMVAEVEARLEVDRMVQEAVEQAEVEEWRAGRRRPA